MVSWTQTKPSPGPNRILVGDPHTKVSLVPTFTCVWLGNQDVIFIFSVDLIKRYLIKKITLFLLLL